MIIDRLYYSVQHTEDSFNEESLIKQVHKTVDYNLSEHIRKNLIDQIHLYEKVFNPYFLYF